MGADRKLPGAHAGAGAVADVAEPGRLREHVDLDAVPHQQVDQLGYVQRIAFGRDQVTANPLLAARDVGAQRLVVLAEQRRPVAGGSARGGPGGQILLLEGVGERANGAVEASELKPAARPLLVQHTDGALVVAERRGVAGIEIVVALAGHILEARRIKRGGVGGVEDLEPAP